MKYPTHTIWSQTALCYDSLKQKPLLLVPLLLKRNVLSLPLIWNLANPILIKLKLVQNQRQGRESSTL